MAFTRQLNDPCETRKRIEESTSVLSHLMDPNKHYNCNPCYIDRVLGGNTVSLYKGNIVDLESDLSGRTRQQTKCPSGKYLPGTIVQGVNVLECTAEDGADGLPCGRSEYTKGQLVHLPMCTMVEYHKRPTDVGYELNYPPCSPMGEAHKKTKKSKCKTRKNLKSPLEYLGQVPQNVQNAQNAQNTQNAQTVEGWTRY